MATGSGTNYSVTTAMSLKLPTPGVCGALGSEPAGTSWMELQNASMALVDTHNHTPGLGVPVPTAGLNINADLTFNSANAIALRTVRFGSIATNTIGAADLGAVFVSGVDLYYVDGSGNQIRLTASGAIAGTPGSIANLASPAAASYTASSKTFSFTSSSGYGATMAIGPLSIQDASVANGNKITLSAPSGLGANYSLTLPTSAPASLAIVTMSSAGAISTFAGITVSGTAFTFPGTVNAVNGVFAATGSTAGISATGGATGPGGIFSGGSSGTYGIQATGGGATGTSTGGYFTGGRGSSGVQGIGTNSGSGIGGDGGDFSGSVNDNNGGVGNGISCVGGAGTGSNATFQAAGFGIQATGGSNTGAGVGGWGGYIIGGNNGGDGLHVAGTGGAANGAVITTSGTGAGINVTGGTAGTSTAVAIIAVAGAPQSVAIKATGAILSTLVGVGYGSSVPINAALGNYFQCIVTNNSAFTVSNPINGLAGQVIIVQLKNTSGAGSGIYTFGTSYRGIGTATISSGQTLSISFAYDGTTWNSVGSSYSFNN